MSSPTSTESQGQGRPSLRRVGLALTLAFLGLSALLRVQALGAIGGQAATAAMLLPALAGVALLLRPWLIGPALELFAASFFLYGFHAYRPHSLSFELVASVLGLVLGLRLLREPRASSRRSVLGLFAPYALVATASLLLLPYSVLEHRLFIDGGGFGRAVLTAFPKDPLYPIAAVARLWLAIVFAWLVAAQVDGRTLLARLFRGVAWAGVLAAALGLLDFAGALSLDRYNLSNLFYGARYRRLQSTFGNPSWYACFAACALPWVVVQLDKARGKRRIAWSLTLPIVAASLFLSGARASWLAALVLFATLVTASAAQRRWGRPLESGGRAVVLALGSTVIVVGSLAANALMTPADDLARSSAPPGRLEGLSRELQYRGVGLSSPRWVAADYALELARLKPILGLGYESFNIHLRAQLGIPGSRVSKVVNTALTADTSETVFDDSHNTYLQVLTGTGLVGLALWLWLVVYSLWLGLQALRASDAAVARGVFAGLVVFHFYGFFQGMAYIPVSFVLLPLLVAYAGLLAPSPSPPGSSSSRAWRRLSVLGPGLVLLVVAAGYVADNGYASLKRRLGVTAYLPDEAEVYEGFYRPESGPAGEFRWMRERAIVNVPRGQPFRLSFTCEHPDVEREPVVLSLRFEGRDLGRVVFRRPGVVEQRFDPDEPGALRLSVSRTFRPGAADRRELGVAVSAIRWE